MTPPIDQHAHNFVFGPFTLSVPEGWKESKRSQDTLTMRSSDDEQQATITGMHFSKDVTFDEFKKLCALRIEAEKREMTDGFVEPTKEVQSDDSFDMFFSGGDRKTKRVFMGYVVCAARELVTIYVESPNGAPKDFGSLFNSIDSWLKINPQG